MLLRNPAARRRRLGAAEVPEHGRSDAADRRPMRARRGNVAATVAGCLAALVLAALAAVSLRQRSASAAPRGGGRPAAAFVVLVGPNSEESNRTRGLTLALHSLYHNYLADHPQPVVLFFADDVPPEQYSPQTLAAVVPPAMAKLVEIVKLPDFGVLPESMDTVTLHDIVTHGGRFPGYHNMCRWNFRGMLEHPRIRKLDFYCRMDTDSRIKKKVEFDIFEHMASRGLHYAYATMNVDYPSKTLGLWAFAADYVETHFNAQQRALLEANGFWGNHSFAAPMKLSFPMVYNEFEVLHVPRFQERDIVRFADAVDATHKIYEKRWGDSPLRWLEMLMFLNVANETEQLDVGYGHDPSNRWQPPKEWGVPD